MVESREELIFALASVITALQLKKVSKLASLSLITCNTFSFFFFVFTSRTNHLFNQIYNTTMRKYSLYHVLSDIRRLCLPLCRCSFSFQCLWSFFSISSSSFCCICFLCSCFSRCHGSFYLWNCLFCICFLCSFFSRMSSPVESQKDGSVPLYTCV